ncbi:hypothetical protein K474DRAFT_1600071, partial [Panus rudis PR-1116 ss-1]
MAIGHWVGFDEESRGHRIYWPERRIVSIERSVRFNIDEPSTATEVPLEGERETAIERLTSAPETLNKENSPSEHETSSPTIPPAPETASPDVLGNNFEPRRSTRIRKPSEYVQRLRGGEGTVSARKSDPVVPKGVQAAVEGLERVEEERAEFAEEKGEWEGVEGEERALAAVMNDAEGLEPTFHEARKRPDWPK